MNRKRFRAIAIAFTILFSEIIYVQPVSAIYNGTSAVGSEHVVKIYLGRGLCSGALVTPQIVATAAHCVVSNGITTAITNVKVSPPGANTSETSVTAGVLKIIHPYGFRNATSFTDPNDIAFLVLDRTFEGSKNLTLANYEMTRNIVNSGTTISIFGYGSTITGGSATNIPYRISGRTTSPMQLSGFQGYERTYISYLNDYQGATCPGDSGGPAIAQYLGITYLVSINSGGLGPCSDNPNRGTWGSTATIPGEYASLYDEAIKFVATLKPSEVRDVQISTSAMEGTISWSAPEKGSTNITGYRVTSSDGTEICKTTSTSCDVFLKVGLNSFYVYSVAGSAYSQGVEIEYQTQNAVTPSFTALDTYESSVLVTWDPDIDYGNAIPDSVNIYIEDSTSGEILCQSELATGECRFDYQAKGYNLEIILESNIGREEPITIGRFSGITANSLVRRTKTNAASISKRISGLIVSNPGYRPELQSLMDEIPVFDEFYVYDEEKLQTIFDISTRLAGLATQIASKPRKLAITCIKGKTTLKVTNIKPTCPTGYKQK
jgi:secreted trypsin-like serine protease